MNAPQDIPVAFNAIVTLVSLVRRVGTISGQAKAFGEAKRELSRRISALEEELARKHGDPYVMGEISALAQIASMYAKAENDAIECAQEQGEIIGEFCREAHLTKIIDMMVLAELAIAVSEQEEENG